jgi:hypothetical protein
MVARRDASRHCLRRARLRLESCAREVARADLASSRNGPSTPAEVHALCAAGNRTHPRGRARVPSESVRVPDRLGLAGKSATLTFDPLRALFSDVRVYK